MDEIVIKTRIDTSGVEKGIEEIKQKLGAVSDITANIGTSMTESIGGAETDIGGLLDNLADRIETFVSDFVEGFTEGMNQAYDEAQAKATKTGDAIDGFTQRLDTNVAAIANTTANLEQYSSGMTKANTSTESASKGMGFFGKALGAVRSALSAVGGHIKQIGARLVAPIKRVGEFAKKFLSIGGAILILRKLTGQIKGAMSSLEGWGTTTSRVISDYKKSMEFLQNAMGAMFAPLIDYFLPKIIAIIDRVAEAFNKLGMYIAALLGQKTYTKAVKGVNDYKDAIAKTGEAANKASGSLAKFDELTIIDTPENDIQNPFVETAIPEEIQQIKSLKDLIESIDWEGAGINAGNFVNNLVSGIREKIENFPAKELAEGLRTFTISALDTVDFTNIGETGATFVNKLAEGIKTYLSPDGKGRSVAESLGRGMRDLTIGFLSYVDSTQLGDAAGTVVNAIGTAITTYLSPDGEGKTVAESLGDAMEDFAISFLKKVDSSQLGDGGAAVVNSIVTGIKAAFDNDENAVSLMAERMNEFVDAFLRGINFRDMGDTFDLVASKIADGIKTAIRTFPADSLADAIRDFIDGAVNGITDFLEDFDLLDFMDTVMDKIMEFIDNIDYVHIAAALVKILMGIAKIVLELATSAIMTPIEFLVQAIVKLFTEPLRAMGNLLESSSIPKIRELGKTINDVADSAEEGVEGAFDNVRGYIEDGLSDAQKTANATIDMAIAQYDNYNEKAALRREQDKKNAEAYSDGMTQVTQEMAMQMAADQEEYANKLQAIEDKKNATMDKSWTKFAEASNGQIVQNKKLRESYEEEVDGIITKVTEYEATVRTADGKIHTTIVTETELIDKKSGEVIGDLHGLGGAFSEYGDKARVTTIDTSKSFEEMSDSQKHSMEKAKTIYEEATADMISSNDKVKQSYTETASHVEQKSGVMSSNVMRGAATVQYDVASKFKSANDEVTSKTSSMASTTENKFASMAGSVSAKMRDMYSNLSTKVGSMATEMSNKFSSMSSTLSSKLTTMATTTSTKFQGMVSTIQGKMGSIFNALNSQNWASVGSNMISGMVSGINAGWSWLSGTVANIASNALATAKRVLGIRSPSRVFRDEVGAMITEGMALGIEDEASAPLKAMDDIAQSLADTAIDGITAPTISTGAIIPTQIATSLARADMNAVDPDATNIDDILSMIRQIRDQQQDLLEALIDTVDRKNFSFSPTAANGRVIQQSLKAYQGVTG